MSEPPTSDSDEALERAVEARDWERAAALVASGVHPDGPRKHGRTLLHRSVMADDLDAVEQLLELGADVDCRFPTGAMTIEVAIGRDRAIFDRLRAAGASLEEVGRFSGESILLSVAGSGWLDLLDELIDAGFSPTVRDPDMGFSLLEAACYRGQTKVVEHLLKRGLSPEPSPYGHPGPLALAEDRDLGEIVALLRAHGARREHPFDVSVSRHMPDDWNDAAGWDAYYRYCISSLRLDDEQVRVFGELPHELAIGWDGKPMRMRLSQRLHAPFPDRRAMWAVRRLPLGSRVLVVGNGMSLLPRAMGYDGYEVVALDLSEVANQVCRHLAPPRDRLVSKFQLRPEAPPAGTVHFVTGNMCDLTLAEGPFDLIVNNKALQGLPPDDRQEALRSMDQRLTDRGYLWIGVHNYERALDEAKAFAREHGYAIDPDRTNDTEPQHDGKTLLTYFGNG